MHHLQLAPCAAACCLPSLGPRCRVACGPAPLTKLPNCCPARIHGKAPTVDYADVSREGGGGGGGGASGGGGAGGASGQRNVFVGNLPPGMNEERLRELFQHYGEVRGCWAEGPCHGLTLLRGLQEGGGQALIASQPDASLSCMSMPCHLSHHGCQPADRCRLSVCTSRGRARATPTPSLASSTSATAWCAAALHAASRPACLHGGATSRAAHLHGAVTRWCWWADLLHCLECAQA